MSLAGVWRSGSALRSHRRGHWFEPSYAHRDQAHKNSGTGAVITPEQTALIERVRTLLADEPVVREVSMFGGRSVMVNEKLIVSALKDGGLLVRVDGSQHDVLLAKPGAIQAEMGPGRDMGPGWIEVTADAIGDDEQLAAWVGLAMDYNRVVTGGHP